MVKYMIRIFSYIAKKPDVVLQILACPTVKKLVFPAVLPIAPKKGKRLERAEEFDLSMVPKAFRDKEHITVPLYGENGLEFKITAYSTETITPSIINLGFTSEHISKDIISLPDLKMLIVEALPIFEAADADVYDQWRPHVIRPDGGITSEQQRYLKGSDGRSHPLDPEWLTYYGPAILDIMGRERFEELRSCFEKIELNSGILVVLQEEPFDRQNPEHVARKKMAEMELRLDELVG